MRNSRLGCIFRNSMTLKVMKEDIVDQEQFHCGALKSVINPSQGDIIQTFVSKGHYIVMGPVVGMKRAEEELRQRELDRLTIRSRWMDPVFREFERQSGLSREVLEEDLFQLRGYIKHSVNIYVQTIKIDGKEHVRITDMATFTTKLFKKSKA